MSVRPTESSDVPGNGSNGARPTHRLWNLGHPDERFHLPFARRAEPEPHVPGYEAATHAAPPLSRPTRIVAGLVAAGIACLGIWLEHHGHGVRDAEVPWPWMGPFVLLLASIALMPFIAPKWWERHYAKVAIGLGAVVVGYYFFVPHGPGNLARAAGEYISFIFLLGSLFIVSGGILIRVRTRATPAANTTLLLVGAVLANLLGTTGASMLLIRPYLRMNAGHLRAYHVVFFIFIVANVGGSLTPIGDPPLFLGYLKGVPFFWILEQCWPIWVVSVSLLLVTFFVIDKVSRRADPARAYDGPDFGPAVSFYGAANLLFVGLILAGILLHGPINHFTEARFGFAGPWRELMMIVAVAGSLSMTPRRVHVENAFSYHPIKEVAYLFIGIFATMLPALNYLYHASSRGEIAIRTPGQFYFAVGSLSSVLDNAPTYLTFLKTQLGTLDREAIEREKAIVRDPAHDVQRQLEGLDEAQAREVRGAVGAMTEYNPGGFRAGTLTDEQIEIAHLIGTPELSRFLVAISMGAVLFGAMTYIGNGPNFMVKSIAEHAGAPVPSFFGYVFRYAVPILLPVLVLIWAIFLI